MPDAAPEQTPSRAESEELIRFEEPSAATESRPAKGLLITMAVLAAAVLVLSVTIGPSIWRVLGQRDAKLAMPETVTEFKRDDSEAAKATAADLLTAMRAKIELNESAAAVYSDPAGGPTKSIMLFGGTAMLWTPERELDGVMSIVERTNDKLRDLESVDPGPLGGVMKCGAIGPANASMAVCGWADNGSIALGLFPERSPADSAFLMRTLRSATLTH